MKSSTFTLERADQISLAATEITTIKIPKIIKKLKKVISDEEFIEFTEINPQKVLNNEDIIK